MGETRKRWTGEEIVAVLERVLVKREEMLKVCDEVAWGRLLGSDGG